MNVDGNRGCVPTALFTIRLYMQLMRFGHIMLPAGVYFSEINESKIWESLISDRDERASAVATAAIHRGVTVKRLFSRGRRVHKRQHAFNNNARTHYHCDLSRARAGANPPALFGPHYVERE